MTQLQRENLKSQWLAEPIAIIGMACRLPGGDGIDEYWETIRDGRNAIDAMPNDRLDRDIYFDAARGMRGKTYSAIGGCVAPRELDWSLLSVASRDAGNWDECHLNFYEVAAQACKDANFDPLNMPHGKTGVFVGHSGGTTLGGELAYRTIAPEYHELLAQSLGSSELADQLVEEIVAKRPARRDGRPMVDAGFAAGLVSHAMGLDGPHMSIDAACASSLVALQLGILSLKSGQADRAIVGGASFNKSDSLVLFSQAQSCSASGSRPFDDSADGLVGSEGYVALVIKTLERAEADGDRVHAVVRGLGLASDGRGKSLWAPRKEGQYEAICRAYTEDVSPDSIQMVEAHATSTKVGDATELTALSEFYRQHLPPGSSVPVGSVKSNLGHTLETAGLAGVVKAVLSMQHGVIPPTINVQRLNTSVSWDESPLTVNRTAKAWPALKPGHPRRAAVNAFGIGGLNVHVVLEDYVGSQGRPAPPVATNPSQDPAAVIGRGIVLPGANDLSQLQQLLKSDASQLTRNAGNRNDNVRAGFIHEFEYDWRKHRIPPKQIAQANPLQFMLLDAAEQAMHEAGVLEGAIDKQRVAVVVGSPFGGDFGNELYAGLRLPEVRKRAKQAMQDQRIAPELQDEMLDRFEADFLKRYPALLDETGSFTSSTLASRLSKTFDLMGGALAIDSGDTSGAAAIDTGRQLLASGSVDYVLCAVAHRALDAAAIENLQQLERLPIADNGSVLVGEGVALVLLTRLDTAKQAGHKVHTVVHDCKAEMGAIGECHVDYSASPLFPLTGYLQASQTITDLICATLQAPNETKALTSSTASGLSYTLKIGPEQNQKQPSDAPQPSNEVVSTATHFAAYDQIELHEQVTAFAEGGNLSESAAVTHHSGARAAIVAADEQSRRLAAKRLSAKLKSSRAPSEGLKQGTIWSTARLTKPTVLWLYPGQGSQSTGMLRDLCTSSPAASTALEAADKQLAALGEPSFEQIAWSETNQLGKDVWHTQASMLIADWIVTQTLRSNHVRCDYVCGHSFGEIPAMLAAGCWDLATALRVTKLRCQSIETVPDRLGLVSVFGTDDQVAGYLRDFGGRSLQISHRNSPQQFVAGGLLSEVTGFAGWLDSRGVVNRKLDVPTSFHTEHLRPAVSVFAQHLSQIPILPPKIPLLSNVHGTFVSDPRALRNNLAEQLVTQLDFVEAIERLKDLGVTHAIEVGPQQVLTKLTSSFAKNWVYLPFDAPQEDVSHRTAFDIAIDMFDLKEANSMADQREQTNEHEEVMTYDVVRFDATAARRNRMREESKTSKTAQAKTSRTSAPVQFDATEKRRSDNRARVPQQKHGLQAVLTTTVPSPKPQPVAATNNSVAQFLIDLIVEQTGYPAEIIELDWAFEADLGIDSIKKAQIFGELREFIDVDSETPLKLDDFVTLRDVVALLESSPGKRDWLEDEQGEDHTSAPSFSAESPQSVDVPAKSEFANILIDFVVEQTGFPFEMVALDADLESDLGIDSIKKAQLLGEVRELVGDISTTEDDPAPSIANKLDSLRSLQDILELFHGNAAVEPIAPQLAQQSVPVSAVSPEAASPATTASASRAPDLTDFLIDFVIDQTGYPREIVELDADLEADLGIDSIKKAQLLGEVQETLAIELSSTSETKISLDSLRTLRDILDLAAPHVRDRFSADAAARRVVASHAAEPGDQKAEPSIAKSSNADKPTALHSDVSFRREENFATVPIRKFESYNDVDYLEAVKRNSKKFVSRNITTANEPTRRVANGIPTSIGTLARATSTSPLTLAALDRYLCENVSWQPSAPEANGDTEWVSTLHVPQWMAESGDVLALEVDPVSGCVLVNTPGCDRPLACIASDTSAAVVENAEHIPSRDQLVAIARQSSGVPDEVPGITRMERGVFNRATAPATATTRHHAAVAQIGYEKSTGHIVLRTLTCPYTGAKAVAIPTVAFKSDSTVAKVQKAPLCKRSGSDDIARRFVLRMAPSRLPDVPGRQPMWAGGAVVVGDNPVARQLESRLKSCGVATTRLVSNGDEFGLRDAFKSIAAANTTPHLFLASAWDDDAAIKLDASWWASRRTDGLLANFWLAQAWLEHIVASNTANDASLIAVSAMGGDFGISGNTYSAEGGGLDGLLKSILIETWMQGYRSLPIKTIDTSPEQSPASIADDIWRELAIPSYDNEVSYSGGMRQVVRAVPRPLDSSSINTSSLPQGGNWVCTGGARGITAYVAENLANRFGMTLHLLGTTSLDGLDTAWRDLDQDGLSQLKKQVLMQARDRGISPVKAWQDTEKILEIDATLLRLREQGIQVHYHVCNCSDPAQVQTTLRHIRSLSGPITGILHGAGIGKDSRFERKQVEKVHQCIAAKVDGSLALMEATRNDPLEYFIGFGSISGRFGANGHTDYSLANEMLCKQVAWLRNQRPEVKAVGFHWHAWGDVGMATKPETRLALEMIDMQFMPAEEGLEHLIREMAAGAPEAEVLVTDDRYYRMFYPAETVLAGNATGETALLDRTISPGKYSCTLDPKREPFLTDHVLDKRPLLPMVVGIELLAEAAERASGIPCRQMFDIEATSALRFFNDAPQEIFANSSTGTNGQIDCSVASRFVGRGGHVSEQKRVNFRGTVRDAELPADIARVALPSGVNWSRVSYPSADSKFYVGWPFQKLRRVAFTPEGLVGQIAAPALIELAGNRRDTTCWRVPSAAMDACLFAVGIYTWREIRAGISLPVGIGRFTLGRLPRPGEACQVHVRPKNHTNDEATFDFSLLGVDGSLILSAENYRTAWIAGEAETSDARQSASPLQES
ncbi:MAG: hypothetical protein Aurels2KO_20750 [Aureliella sp.]